MPQENLEHFPYLDETFLYGLNRHNLQVYQSYYNNPSLTPYKVGAAASEDYIQEFIKDEFTAICNQVATSKYSQSQFQ